VGVGVRVLVGSNRDNGVWTGVGVVGRLADLHWVTPMPSKNTKEAIQIRRVDIALFPFLAIVL
jgi:hypothetical protein